MYPLFAATQLRAHAFVHAERPAHTRVDAAMGSAASCVMRHHLSEKFLALVADQSGQDVVEYGVIIATIAMVVLLGVTAFGSQVRPWFEHLAGRITTVGT